MDDLHEPDEARPAKRVRLEAPLEITEELQEEIVDDGDWDDIYGLGSTLNKAEQELSLDSPNHLGGTAAAVEEELPADAIEDRDDLNQQRGLVAATDGLSAKLIEETTQVETESPYQIESPPRESASDDEAYEPSLTAQDEARVPVADGDHLEKRATNGEIADAAQKVEEDKEFLEAAAAQKDSRDAEWQFDSSDAESSDSDSESSSDDSEDSASGSEEGYEMLDPATAARILMAGDGDDDDGNKDKSSGDQQPRTANERKEAVVVKPDVVVTEDMKITPLGTVDRVVDNQILVKAFTPGEFQVLEYGSVLCTENRQVIGTVADTIGRVQQPMYSVAFNNTQEIEDAGLTHQTKIFYVDHHSTFVFTQPLKNMKGTDASNLHDEEAGEDEIEFSDDEKEAEFKRMKKLAKKEGRGGMSRGAFQEAKASGNPVLGTTGYDRGHAYTSRSDAPQQQYGGGISYDDVDVKEEFYTPLKRPDNLSQLMANGGPPRAQFGALERGRGRGRGDRGRGRGDRGRGRGGFDHRNQRGGRGGHNQDRGGSGQHNEHKGNAQSYSDRHNGHKTHGQKPRSLPPRASPPQASSGQAQGYSPQQSQPHQQPQSPQTYQFNGYTFQYGNPPPPPPAAYHAQQPLTAQAPGGSIPAGSYVNPAFFQNQQQWSPTQQQPNYTAWQQQPQPNAQPYYAASTYGAAAQQQQSSPPPLPPTQQQPPPPPVANLAEILRQLGGQQR